MDGLSEEDVTRIKILYGQLEGLWIGLEGKSKNTTGGPLDQLKVVIEELNHTADEDYDSFLPHCWQTKESKSETCDTADLRAQISSLLGNLRVSFLPGQLPHFVKEAPASQLSVTQNVSQDVQVTQTIILDVANTLVRKENSYKTGTKEHKFITLMQDGLKAVKDTSSLLMLIFNTAHSVGLTLDKVREIFS